MPVTRNEAWVQVAELDEQDQIRFTREFQELMGELGWEAKAFVIDHRLKAVAWGSPGPR